MKKITLLLFVGLLFTAHILPAQSAVSSDPFDVQSRFYKLALKNYDLQAATIAVYNMLAIKPDRTDLNDTLTLLYFAAERYAQASLLGEEILKADPKRKDILELVAVCKQNMGLIKEALGNYENLYAADKSVYYLYQIATLQYQLKRYGECIASLDQIIGNAETEKQKVSIRVQGGSQDVPMKAAAFNIKGICALELNQEEAAKDNFKKALELFPDFALAKGNLEAIDKKKTETKQPAATTKTSTTTTKPQTPATK